MTNYKPESQCSPRLSSRHLSLGQRAFKDWKTVRCAQEDQSQLLALPFFAGSRPVASRYLLIISSWVLGKHGWYLQYSIVYSPFPCSWQKNSQSEDTECVILFSSRPHPNLWNNMQLSSTIKSTNTEACGYEMQRHTNSIWTLSHCYRIARGPISPVTILLKNWTWARELITAHLSADRISVLACHETWDGKSYVTNSPDSNAFNEHITTGIYIIKKGHLNNVSTAVKNLFYLQTFVI